jgi:hypothetical protein
MSEKPDRLSPAELDGFLSSLFHFSGSDEQAGMVVRLAYLCMKARIAYYAPPKNGVEVDFLHKVLRVSKHDAKKFLAEPLVQKLFVVDDGLIQVSPEYDFFRVLTPARKSLPQQTRESVQARDKKRCVYCGSTESLQFDHLYPVSKGGTDEPNNLVLACQDCNLEKSDMTLLEWMEKRNA